MRIVRWATNAGPVLGYLDGEYGVPVSASGAGTQDAALDLALAATADPGWRPAPVGDPVPVDSLPLLAPVDAPSSVRDFYAFEQHVRTARSRRGLDMHPDWYELPVFYFSNHAAIVGPGAPVAAPPRSAELDFELEVAFVLGRSAATVTLDSAADLVAGFLVMNDWSARDIQRREMALSMGPVKGKDFATSLGPWLVTPDEFAPGGLRDVPSATMSASVNGVEYSRADLASLWWSFAEMLCYAGESTVLRRGDVIGSGTCGTGCILELSLVHGAEKYPYLSPGDEVSLHVDGLGTLTNPIVAATAAAWATDPDRIRPESPA